MRRRIDTYENYSDHSDHPNHSLDCHDGTISLHEPLPVLRDEALWSELQAAYARVTELERRVDEACANETLDAVEVECGVQLWRLTHAEIPRDPEERKRMSDEIDRLHDILREHARTA